MAAERDNTLSQLAGVIGVELSMKLASRFGGRRMHIPLDPPATSELVAEIGLEAAQRLARRWGGTHFDMPISRAKRERIIALSNSDAAPPVSEIARLCGCTERHVYQVRRAHREGGGEALWVPEPDLNQLEIFSPEDK